MPEIPYPAWAVFFAALFTLLNLRGVKASARINEGLAVGMGVVILIFFVSAIRYLLGHPAAQAWTRPFYDPATFRFGAVFTGTSIAALTYIGFDGVSTLAEEVKNPRRNVLLAAVLTCLITGIWSGAQVYLAQQDYDGAISDFTQVIKLDPRNVVAWVSRGQAYAAAHDFENAVGDLNQAIKLSPAEPSVYANLGQIMQTSGNITQALESFTRALTVDPNYAPAYYYRALAYAADRPAQQLGVDRRVVDDLTAVLALEPWNTDAYLARAQAYLDGGDLDKALADYNLAVVVTPDNLVPLLKRGHLNYVRRDYEAALKDYNKALEIEPESIEALHDVLKNELAAGVMPCGRVGANAAWLRFSVLTHNVLTALKRIALKPEWLRARPKRLRFQIFFSPGKLVHHARQVLLKVGRLREQLSEWAEGLRLLPATG